MKSQQNQIDDEFPDGITDEQAKARVFLLAFPIQLEWETHSKRFSDILTRINWWEVSFSQRHPATYERLKKSFARRSNAQLFTSTFPNQPLKNLWKSLLISLHTIDQRVIQQPGRCSINPADEFGVDMQHEIVYNEANQPLIRATSVNATSRSTTIVFHDLYQEAFRGFQNHRMDVEEIWTVPFQNSAVVLLRNAKTNHRELAWIRTPRDITSTTELQINRDASLWAINHNMLTENPEDFKSPPYLNGDASLDGPKPLIFATEGRTDIENVRMACVGVFVRQRDLLVFDQVIAATTSTPKHWRHLLTHEQAEPRRIPVSAACWILDSMLLYASHDGALRAHPRGNLLSTYHVENVGSLVPHLVGLYNVVAIIHSYHILEVRLVCKVEHDPFIAFKILYSTPDIDCCFRPLLYGPFVIFAGLDGLWYRVQYDVGVGEKHLKEIVKIPFHAGWSIVSIKNASWRYWTVTLREPGKDILVDCVANNTK